MFDCVNFDTIEENKTVRKKRKRYDQTDALSEIGRRKYFDEAG